MAQRQPHKATVCTNKPRNRAALIQPRAPKKPVRDPTCRAGPVVVTMLMKIVMINPNKPVGLGIPWFQTCFRQLQMPFLILEVPV